MDSDTPVVPPLAALALAVVAVSTSAILIRWSRAPSSVAAFYRVLFTTLLLAPVAVVRYREAFARLSMRDWLVAASSGLALAAHFAAWFESLEWTSVAASVTLVQTQPVFVALGAAWLLEERLNRRIVVGIGVALAGSVLLSVGDLLSGGAFAGSNPLYGDALALVGALAAAGYVLAGRSLRQRLPLIPYVIVVYTVSAIGLLVWTVGQGASLGPYPPREWMLFLAMAVGPGIFGHTVVNWALAHVESSVVSVTLVGEPVGSTLLALLLLGEVPPAMTAVGGVVVLVGIVLTARARPNP
ncbi:DMT family transporter [Halapricum desulfuricans]|uniref:Permease of the drug/metabolite transporter (DMT) superfamily n=1 Tax=Halapricum desulfuricans TaxID=2841257 RepID=A0A897NX94_9EURY|nr:DMT family transporter [Halapricum desulfuricans]QSG14736.1 Permease of the drug/metabolite transporter (DMT) superfamily [Halapricum desulfuricans]